VTARRRDFYGKRRAKLHGRPAVYGRGERAAGGEWVARRRLRARFCRHLDDRVVTIGVEIAPRAPGGPEIEAFIPLSRRQAARLARWILERTGGKPA
jgi:hypothetical protein